MTVRYHGAPSSGLVFSAEREQICTIFSTSQWMVALDEPTQARALRSARDDAASVDGRGKRPRWACRDLPGDKVLMECSTPARPTRSGSATGAFAEGVGDRSSRRPSLPSAATSRMRT